MATATTATASRPSATIAVLLVLLIAAAAQRAGASELSLYSQPGCLARNLITVCSDGQCCNTPDNAASYSFNYKTNKWLYLYDQSNCDGNAQAFGESVQCSGGLDFQSAAIANGLSLVPRSFSAKE